MRFQKAVGPGWIRWTWRICFFQEIPDARSVSALRGRRHSLGVALRERLRAKLHQDVAESWPWKLVGLVPLMLLHRPRGTGSIGREASPRRAHQFAAGGHLSSSQLAKALCQPDPRTINPMRGLSRRDEAGLPWARSNGGKCLGLGMSSRGAVLGPKTAETFQELQNKRPREQVSEIPREVMDFSPSEPLVLSMKTFVSCFRSSPSGSAAGRGGCTNEMLRVCDVEATQLLHLAAEDFARGPAPLTSRPFMLATMTALTSFSTCGCQDVGSPVWHGSGDSLRSPPGCAVYTSRHRLRGTCDSSGHRCRSAGYSFVNRRDMGVRSRLSERAMLSKLLEVPGLRALVPFVRTLCSTFVLVSEGRRGHAIPGVAS